MNKQEAIIAKKYWRSGYWIGSSFAMIVIPLLLIITIEFVGYLREGFFMLSAFGLIMAIFFTIKFRRMIENDFK